MFKKLFWLSLSLFAYTLHADVFVEGKAAYFRPTNRDFREIYSDGGIYGFEVTGQAWRDLYAWGSADCFYQSGSTSGFESSTTLTMVPLGLGLKYLFPVKSADFYFGAGMLGTYLHTKDNSPFVIRNSSNWGFGGIVKAGIYILAREHLFIDLFTDYSFMKVDFHHTDGGRVIRHQADLSGWSIGAGIGYRFGANCRH
jgi:hypothetical protein